jgi:two-component system, OmpR family, sensor kinase
MSLRARVLIGVLALTTLAMAGLGVVVYSFLDRYLTQRVDEDLQRSALPIIGYVQRGFIPPDRPEERAFNPSRLYTQVRDAAGRLVKVTPVMNGDEQLAAPDLSSVHTVGQPQGVDYLTTDSVDGSPSYRVQVTQLNNGTAVIIAAPLTDVEDTLSRLVTVEVVATVAVVLALAGLVTWVVRRGLRPLGDVVVAADAVAAGDLSHRVPVPNPRTEVGHLGVAFNTMVDRIEASFAERDELEERLRRFVADASHELRTPLTSIRGYAELFRRGAADDPDQLALAMRRIEDEASRMGILVDDLLLLARLDQGRPLEREPVELVALVDDAVADARAVEPNRPISFVDPGRQVVVSGDDVRLHQVVANLLANARVHTPEGTPVAVRVDVDGPDAVVEVADEGPGMTPEAAAHVFERFYRADSSRNRRHGGGAGLGLAIVAAVVSAHGGRVSAAATPGRGARFVVHLPMGLPPPG